MYSVARSAIVKHSAEKMYLLVSDIDSYPLFLPWCDSSEVLTRSEHEMSARVGIAFHRVSKSFTTRNRLEPFERITMSLQEGPFSELYGGWAFKWLEADACRISLDLRFDFSSAIISSVMGPVFEQIANSMVESFVQRAEYLYPKAGAASATTSGTGSGMITLEVVYALPERQVVEVVQLMPNNNSVTIEQAIRASSILQQFPEINLAHTAVGVFGVQRALNWALADQDRVEIYRPLHMSPTEARARRANSRKERKAKEK